MMLNKYEEREKEFIAIIQEYDDLSNTLRRLPLLPLPEPIHKGWDVRYELRSDVANRDDAHYIKWAMKIGYRDHHIKGVRHIRAIRSGQKGYWSKNWKGQRNWVSYTPTRLHIKQAEYDKLPPQVAKFFHRDRWSLYYWERDKYVAHIPPHWLVLRTKPHYHTHYEDRGGPLYQRHAYLHSRLREYWRTVGGDNGYKQWSRNPYRTTTRAHIRQFLKNEREDIPSVSYKKMIKK